MDYDGDKTYRKKLTCSFKLKQCTMITRIYKKHYHTLYTRVVEQIPGLISIYNDSK